LRLGEYVGELNRISYAGFDVGEFVVATAVRGYVVALAIGIKKWILHRVYD